jgi:hypothetical protein
MLYNTRFFCTLCCPAGQQQLAGQHQQLHRGHERVGQLCQPAQQAGAAGSRGEPAAGGGALPEPQWAFPPTGDDMARSQKMSVCSHCM